MAKNKKPRKPYHPKPVRTQCVIQEDIDSLQAMVRQVSLATELSLPAGSATPEQIECIKVMLNHAMTGLMSREYLSAFERADALKKIDEGGDALVGMVKKAFDRRDKAKAKAARFICTADELNAIRNAVAIADQFLTDSYEVEPNRTMREFFAMKTLLARGAKDPTIEQVNKIVSELSRVETCKWRSHK